MNPAMRPMRSVNGVPDTITANRLRPCLSLPNGNACEGGWRGRTEMGRASWRFTKREPMTEENSKNENMTRPTTSDGLRWQ